MQTIRTHQDWRSRIESISTWTGRLCVLAMLVYVPWNYGMVSWDQQVLLPYWALLVSAVTLVVLLARRQAVTTINLFVILLLGLLGMGLVQTLSLPTSAFDSIAPAAKFEQASILHAATQLGIDESQLQRVAKSERQQETTLSIHPVQTRCSLSIFAVAITTLLCCSILFNDKRSRIVFLITSCAASSAIAILGILQSISWNSWTLLPMPHSANFATFVSRNSAPQYLSIGIGCTLALIGMWKSVKAKRRKRNYQQRYLADTFIAKIRHVLEDLVLELDALTLVLISVLVTHIVAVIAAASRGGFIALFFSAGVCLLFFLAMNRRWIIAGLGGLVVLTSIASMALDLFELDDQISERMQDFDSGGRLELWTSSLQQSDYWLTGSGMGTYRFAIMHVNPLKYVWPHHAESIFVEIAVEFGLFGLVVALVGLAWLFVKLLPSVYSMRNRLWPAALYSVTAIVIHSLMDFSLIIPAIFIPLAVTLGAFFHELVEKRGQQQLTYQLGSRVTAATIILSLAAIIGFGHSALKGFAQAERLSQWFKKDLHTEVEAAAGLKDVANLGSEFPQEQFDYAHPEVVLVLSRIRLAALESAVKKLPDWPDSLTLAEQRQLSSAEFIAAVLRSTPKDPIWESRRSFFAKHPMIAEQLSICNTGFRFAAKACKLDWRSDWGRFQTFVQRNPNSDVMNWSRLDRSCGSIYNTQEVLGTCCLIAGEIDRGVQSWKAAVGRDPLKAAGLTAIVGDLLSFEDVRKILLDYPMATVQLSRSLSAQQENLAMQLLKSVDLARLSAVASDANDWELLAWANDKQGNAAAFEESLTKLASLRPFDVATRYQLAQLLEEKGQTAEAIKLLEQASRRASGLPPQVQDFLSKLQKSQR